MDHILIATAIIKKSDQILLVRQHDEKADIDYWSLPSGKVEPGELLHEALKREVLEETGLEISDTFELIYTAHTISEPRRLSWLTSAFLIENAVGELKPNDPDQSILEAQYFPLATAITLIEKYQPLKVMKTPILNFLRGQDPAGTIWFFRETFDSEYKGEKKVPASRF